MKLFHFILSLVFSLLMFSAQSVYAVYGTDDVDGDTSAKAADYGTEVEINEFVLLDAMPSIELYYYPYSATDADVTNLEDVPGGAGSVYVGGGEVRWHANIDSTISIDDFTLTHTDTAVTERNTIAPASVYVSLDATMSLGSVAVAALAFDDTHGDTIVAMSTDMNAAYALSSSTASRNYDTDVGHTDFAVKFQFRVKLSETGGVQGPGAYQATATVRAVQTVSS